MTKAQLTLENDRLQQENARLRRDRTEARDQQMATNEILGVIASSPTDVQPVFDAIADSAARLTGAVIASVYEFDGSQIHLRVIEPADWPHGDEFRRNFPRPPAPDFAAGRVLTPPWPLRPPPSREQLPAGAEAVTPLRDRRSKAPAADQSVQ